MGINDHILQTTEKANARILQTNIRESNNSKTTWRNEEGNLSLMSKVIKKQVRRIIQ